VKKFLTALALALLTFCPAADAAQVIVDRILATVNGEIITLSEFEKYKSMLLMGVPEKPTDVEADRQMLGQLIEKKLILQEAKKLDITLKDKDVEHALDDVQRRNKIDLKTLIRELAKQGTTLDEYKKVLEGEILQSQTIGRAVQAKVTVSDKDIQEFYEQNVKGQEKKGARVRIQQILLLIPNGAGPGKIGDIEKTVKDLHRRILAGEDFGKLAVENSQGAGAQLGGDIGFFYKDELMPEIEKMAFSLNKGQVSPVFRTEIGFHIIKVIDLVGDGDGSGNDNNTALHAQEREIKNILYNTEFEKELRRWLTGLREKAYIELN
jgi:peptidyl-prolyl cis-trans isomerase SurA